MLNIIFKFVVFLCLFSSLDSRFLVNNVTVSRDFFQEQFLKKIRSISNLSDLIKSDEMNAQKCVLELKEIVKQLPKMEVLPFIDSWGILPSGVLYGHLADFGNYDQCVRTTVTLDESLGATTGQYCLMSLPIDLPSKSIESEAPRLRDFQLEERISGPKRKIKIGVCVPDTCSEEVTTKIFQNALKNVFGGVLSNVRVFLCSVSKKPDYEAIDIFAIVLYSSIGLLMVLSTLYDVLTSHREKEPVQLLIAFSIIANGRKLFVINTKTSTNSIDCLNGMRVLSMVWVMFGHNYMVYSEINLMNSIDMLSWYKRFYSMTVLMGSVSVDSFLFLSGLLVAWLGLQELDKKRGKLNVVMMYIHRYIRLTPPVAAMILFFVSLNKYIGSGPFRSNLVEMHNDCKNKWWTTLLYIQNYAYPKQMCIVQSWYLAVDTQLYVISPLILMSLWKWGKKCVPVLIILALLSIGCVVGTFIVEGYTDITGINGDEEQKTYYGTHTRYSVWIVGICTGYFLHLHRQRAFRLSMIVQLIGWILCFGTLLSIVFAPYFTIDSSHTVGEAATYESLKRVSWAIALAWIVVACHHGFGGIVNSILSHPIWQPFSRLTYSMYLVHLAVITINLGSLRTDVYFSDYRLMLEFWSTFGISLLVSIALSLSFEAPVLVLEKAMLGTHQPNRKLKEPTQPSVSNKTSLEEHKEV